MLHSISSQRRRESQHAGIAQQLSDRALRQTVDILIEQGTIARQLTRPVAQLLLAALYDAALAVAEFAEPRNEA
jgi:hypothetical protein